MATSVSKIENMLVQNGANNILKGYDDDRELLYIQFSMVVNGNSMFYKITAYRNVIAKILLAEYTRPTEKSHQLVAQQSGRTAWKIICDWVEIQLTMVMLEQMEMAEAFMTKTITQSGQTLFEVVKAGNFKLLN
jgi:hypothetical protein